MNDSQGGGGGHQYHHQPPSLPQQHKHTQQQQSHHNQHLGVHKMGKAIKKSPIHQPNFSNPAIRPQQPPQPQPQVYNISKNDFRSIVQQLTSGTPSRDPSPNPPSIPKPSPPPPPRPSNPHRPQQSERLKRIRPPPLIPIPRQVVPQPRHQPTLHNPNPIPFHNTNTAVNPNQSLNPSFMPRQHPPPAQFPPPLSPLFSPSPLSNPFWASATESPVSAYMRYLENSIPNPEASRNVQLTHPQAQAHGQSQPQHPPPHTQFQQPPAPVKSGAPPEASTGLLPTPSNGPVTAFPSPRGPGPSQLQAGFFPSPGMPSPTFSGLLSPRSPYPLLSPGFQFPPPLSPSFFNSPISASTGILGPGPLPPPSPGLIFPPSPYPLSPSAFFLSPRWRNL